jgi:hypothetical protein
VWTRRQKGQGKVGEYENFIQSAKKFANGGETQRLSLMKLLIDTEARKSIWHSKTTHTSWDILLREEGLCTPSLFHDFKRARGVVDVEVFGVYASAALVKLNTEYRSKIVRSTQRWIDAHRVPPTYQRITKYVAELKKELGIRSPSTPIRSLRAENSRLKREVNRCHEYIDTLQAVLKKNHLPVPREP